MPALSATAGEKGREMKSTFDLWFEAQHGKRPKGDVRKLLASKHPLEVALLDIKSRIDSIKLWDARWQSARYAWNLRGSTDADIRKAAKP